MEQVYKSSNLVIAVNHPKLSPKEQEILVLLLSLFSFENKIKIPSFWIVEFCPLENEQIYYRIDLESPSGFYLDYLHRDIPKEFAGRYFISWYFEFVINPKKKGTTFFKEAFVKMKKDYDQFLSIISEGQEVLLDDFNIENKIFTREERVIARFVIHPFDPKYWKESSEEDFASLKEKIIYLKYLAENFHQVESIVRMLKLLNCFPIFEITDIRSRPNNRVDVRLRNDYLLVEIGVANFKFIKTIKRCLYECLSSLRKNSNLK